MLGIIHAGRRDSRLVLEQVRSGRDATNGLSAAIEMPAGRVALASLGFADGGNGAPDLVLWSGGDDRSAPTLDVVRLTESSSQVIASTRLPRSMTIGERSQLVMADVVPNVAGEEIILTAEVRHGQGTRLSVYGGAPHGQLRLLRSLYTLGRAAGRRVATAFAVADVVPGHPGPEIVAGGREGWVLTYGIERRRLRHLRTFNAFPETPGCSASRLAAGDLIPSRPGDEVVIGDDGTRGDARVRIFDGDGRLATEFRAFSGDATAGIEVWVGDIVPALPGAELLVGQGPAGGHIRVFSVQSGNALPVTDVPFTRTTSLQRHLTVADLLPGLPGLEVAVAQADSDQPIRILNFASGSGQLAAQLLSDDPDPVAGIFGN